MNQAVASHITAVARPTLDPRVLSSATMADLLCLYDAFERSDDALGSIFNMPRCEGVASRAIDDENDRVRWLRQSVVDEARRREPAGEDLELKTEIIVRWAFRCGSFVTDDPRLKVLIALVEVDA